MIGQHRRAILQFSGGKDSTALLHLARPYLDRIEVVHVDAGAEFPHVTEHVHRTAAGLGVPVTILKPHMPVTEFTEALGLPADVVPAWNVLGFVADDRPRQLLQSPAACCNAMIWQPAAEHVRRSGATLVLRGVKACDARRGVPPGFIEDGVEYGAPLWGWSDLDVMEYLAEQGAEMPEHYSQVNDGLDCWNCTAYLATAYGADRLRYVRENHPDLWPVLADRLDRVRAAVADEWGRVQLALDQMKEAA